MISASTYPGARRGFTVADRDRRRQSVAELRRLRWATHRIGLELGIDDRTVVRDLEALGVATPERVIGRDGREYRPHRERKP